jgi:hypothetical protein
MLYSISILFHTKHNANMAWTALQQQQAEADSSRVHKGMRKNGTMFSYITSVF